MKSIHILFLLLWSSLILAQNDQGFFEVEFEKFSPPTQDLIRNFVGKNATPFLAPDTEGNELYLGNYKGKKVIIWFWSIRDQLSLDILGLLNLLQQEYKHELQIVSFAAEDKQEIIDFKKSTQIDFPVIYKGDLFGEAAYAKDLGYGRLFFVNKKGVIKQVLPREALLNAQDRLYLTLENVYNSQGL